MLQIMKHLNRLFPLLLAGLLFSSCDFLNNEKEEELSIEDDFEIVKVNEDYVMKIPNYMTKTNDLNSDASLQYQNIFKETYVIVIDEAKGQMIDALREIEEFDETLSLIKNYRNIQLQYSFMGIDVLGRTNERSLKINGLNAEIIELEGRAPDIDYDIAYFLTFIEGREKVYMIMAWTLKNRIKKYRPTFEKIAHSFELY